jgi:hypothetical protein
MPAAGRPLPPECMKPGGRAGGLQPQSCDEKKQGESRRRLKAGIASERVKYVSASTGFLTTVTPPLPRGSYLAPLSPDLPLPFTLPAANLNLLLLSSYLPPAGMLTTAEN